MNLQPVIARLKAQCPGFRLVAGTSELLATTDGVIASPAAFVIPAEDAARDEEGLDDSFQIVDVVFGVIIVLSSAGSRFGAESLTALEPLRASVEAALGRWTPSGAELPISYVGGARTHIEPGLLWWEDRYRTAVTLSHA